MNAFEIDEIRIENCADGCITDHTSPVIAFSLKSSLSDTKMTKARISIGDYVKVVSKQTGIVCRDVVKKPFTEYKVIKYWTTWRAVTTPWPKWSCSIPEVCYCTRRNTL